MQGVAGMGLEEEEWHVAWVQYKILVYLFTFIGYFNCPTLYIRKQLFCIAQWKAYMGNIILADEVFFHKLVISV